MYAALGMFDRIAQYKPLKVVKTIGKSILSKHEKVVSEVDQANFRFLI